MTHMDEDVASLGELAHPGARPAVSGIDERAGRAVEPETVAGQIGLDMADRRHADRPAAPLDDIAAVQLLDEWHRREPRQGAAARLVDAETGLVLDPRGQVGLEGAVRPE